MFWTVPLPTGQRRQATHDAAKQQRCRSTPLTDSMTKDGRQLLSANTVEPGTISLKPSSSKALKL